MLLLTGTNIDLGSFRLPIAYLSWIAQKYKRENNELKKKSTEHSSRVPI